MHNFHGCTSILETGRFPLIENTDKQGSIFNQWKSTREQRWSDAVSLESNTVILWTTAEDENRGASTLTPSSMRCQCFKPCYERLAPFVNVIAPHLAALKIVWVILRGSAAAIRPFPNASESDILIHYPL